MKTWQCLLLEAVTAGLLGWAFVMVALSTLGRALASIRKIPHG